MAKRITYDWTQFTLKILIKSDIDKVFKAWTDEREIIKWFPVKAAIEPRKGGRLYFEWLGDDKLETKVIAVKKNRLFHFPFGSNNEQVKVILHKRGKTTICELHQFNMLTKMKSKVNMHMGCKEGWVFFLANLKSYLENKKDLRSHDPKYSYKTGFINS